MTISQQNEIIEILQQYQIKYQTNGILELTQDQNLSVIPSTKITEMLGLIQDEGHRAFIDILNQIEKEWLLIFFKYESYYEVYDNEEAIIKHNYYILIHEILDGLR